MTVSDSAAADRTCRARFSHPIAILIRDKRGWWSELGSLL